MRFKNGFQLSRGEFHRHAADHLEKDINGPGQDELCTCALGLEKVLEPLSWSVLILAATCGMSAPPNNSREMCSP